VSWTTIFALIELLLKVFGLFDGFTNYLDAKRLAEDEAKRQAREAAVDAAAAAKTAKDAYAAQDGIVNNEP
jgi:hypothetical protein